MIDPVMVIGTGRCGSSFVSGIFHKDFHISMGTKFKRPDTRTVGGDFEDAEIKRNNQNLLNNDVTFHGWMKIFSLIIENRCSVGGPWGYKDPRTIELLGLHLSFFDRPKIIWCIRNRDLVIKSLVEKFSFTEDRAKLLHDSRIVFGRRLMRGRDYLPIRFTEERRSREDVIQAIHDKWGGEFDAQTTRSG